MKRKPKPWNERSRKDQDDIMRTFHLSEAKRLDAVASRLHQEGNFRLAGEKREAAAQERRYAKALRL